MRRRRKLVIGITGASGAPYAKRLLGVLAERQKSVGDVEVAAVLSSTAKEVWALECGGQPEDMTALGIPMWGGRNYKAPFASGSAGWDAMAIVPCSMGTVGRIAGGISESLLTRAADVMLKEGRTLVLVPRESPLSVIHLENLTTLARAGARIVPAMPSFYGKPKSIEDVIDTVVSRVLDHLGVDNDLAHRWGEEEAT